MKRTIGLAAMLMIGLIISSCISSIGTKNAKLADRRGITPNKFVAATPPVPETVIEPMVGEQGTEKLLPKLPSAQAPDTAPKPKPTEEPEPAKEKEQRERKSRKSRKSRGSRERKIRGGKERKSRKSRECAKREKKKSRGRAKRKGWNPSNRIEKDISGNIATE
ncbi:hypothetical protein AGMMS49990_09460 [Endomicrobiia bacterium]|nr:hypothetical protein AGMMS49990_09460 [Endomicrobiia bacterium]